jgi:hypothetical protein
MTEENFNIVEKLQTYNNSKQINNSKAYKMFAENKIDNFELLDIDKEDAAGTYPIKEEDPKIQKANEKSFINDLLELGENLSNSDVVTSIKSRVPEGLINVADFGTNIFNSFDKLFSLDPNYERSEIFNKWSENLGNVRNKLREKREDVEGSFSDMAGMVFQDAPYTLALYPIFSKFMSKPKAAVLSFGVGYGMSFDEESPSMFMDSETVSKLKHLIKVLPDTPEDQLTDDVYEMFEGTLMATLIPGVIKSFKFIKNNLSKETLSDISKIVAGGSVIAGSVAGTKAQSDEIPPIPEPININEKPIIDASDPQVMEMGWQSGLTKIGEKVLPKIIEKGKEIIKPIFKSNVVEAVNKIPNKGSGNQILGQIINIPGVKETELKWIGLDDYLKNKKSVTKQEVSEFVQSNRIDVNETQFPKKATGTAETVRMEDDLVKLKSDFEDKWLQENINPKYKGSLSGQEIINKQLKYDTYLFRETADAIEKHPKKNIVPGYYDFSQLKATEVGKTIDSFIETNAPKDWLKKYMVGNKAVFVELADRLSTRPNRPVIYEESMANYLLKSGETVKDEITNKALDRFVHRRTLEFDPLTIQKYEVENLNRNINKIKSETKGTTKFEQYTESGGKDYTELVFSLKTGGKDIGVPIVRSEKSSKAFGEKALVPFKGGHFGVKSEIAHVRFKTRDLNGKKVLTVEEMQSDFAIAAKRKEGEFVEDFPFKQNWYELTVKRLIRYAADNGFDAVAIPKGSVAAARYGQKGGIATKVQIRDFDNHIQVFYKDKKGELISDPTLFKISGFESDAGKKIEAEAILRFKKAVGEDIANSYLAKLSERRAVGTDKRMMSLTLPMQTFEFKKPIFAGSGKGKHELYDKAIPSFMKKYAKKWNAKVYDDSFDIYGRVETGQAGHDMPVTILELTPAMKKAVQEGSQSLFEILGTLTASGVAAKSLSDSQGNNTISN